MYSYIINWYTIQRYWFSLLEPKILYGFPEESKEKETPEATDVNGISEEGPKASVEETQSLDKAPVASKDDTPPAATVDNNGTTESVPGTTDSLPGTTDSMPVTTDSAPGTTDRQPATTDSLSGTTDNVPTTTDSQQVTNGECQDAGVMDTKEEADVQKSTDEEPKPSSEQPQEITEGQPKSEGNNDASYNKPGFNFMRDSEEMAIPGLGDIDNLPATEAPDDTAKLVASVKPLQDDIKVNLKGVLDYDDEDEEEEETDKKDKYAAQSDDKVAEVTASENTEDSQHSAADTSAEATAEATAGDAETAPADPAPESTDTDMQETEKAAEIKDEENKDIEMKDVEDGADPEVPPEVRHFLCYFAEYSYYRSTSLLDSVLVIMN